jgi:myo-inositol-1(or 4)-monophosphatase
MQNELHTAIEAAQAAGKILLEYYQSDYAIKDKSWHNPVTTADYASNQHLEEHLREAYPTYGWLSEETADSGERLQRQRIWVVDPLDGTKEFIEGVPQFVVSVALVEDREPVLGVLYNPLKEETFAGLKGQGATLNGQPITCSQVENLQDAVIVNSRTETRHGLWESYHSLIGELRAVGSVAYKLGLVAAGQADVFATLKPKNEWDVCAGHLILREAGAIMRVLTGERRSYNNREVIIKPGLAAGNPAIVQAFLELYRTIDIQ